MTPALESRFAYGVASVPGLSFTPFQMPTLVDEPPEGEGWIHEVKYDGYRTQLIVEAKSARAFTRNGHDWTAKYPQIVEAAAKLKCRSAILGGEVIVPTSEGASDFAAVRSALKVNPARLVFVAFDLMHLDGRDMRPLTCIERRASLWKLVAPAEGHIQFSQHMDGSGKAFFAAVEAMNLEGIVSKRAGSAYVGGPVKTWLKTKCYVETDYEIAGVLRERGKPAMALMADAQRNYVGSAFITLNKSLRERLWARVKERAGPAPKGFKPRPGAEWLKPGLVGRVKHLRGEEKLRHATLKDVLDDG